MKEIAQESLLNSLRAGATPMGSRRQERRVRARLLSVSHLRPAVAKLVQTSMDN